MKGLEANLKIFDLMKTFDSKRADSNKILGEMPLKN